MIAIKWRDKHPFLHDELKIRHFYCLKRWFCRAGAFEGTTIRFICASNKSHEAQTENYR